MSIIIILVIIAIIGIFFEATRLLALLCFAILLYAGSFLWGTIIILGWWIGYNMKKSHFK